MKPGAGPPTQYRPLDLMNSSNFFGRHFQGPNWASWRVVLGALSGHPLTESEQQTYQRCTGRKYSPPVNQSWAIYRELWMVIGRGGGKSLISAVLVLSLVVRAIVEKLPAKLAPGERLTVMSISAELRQTRVVLGYIKGFIAIVPLLKSRVVHETQNSIEFRDGIVIETHTASFRSTRGYSLLGVVLDELAYFRSDEHSANQDEQILAAIRPGLARVPESLLICISSPWGRRGSLWKAYSKYFGKHNDRVLVWQADSLTMNPTLDAEAIKAAYVEDESSAAAEWGGQFRRDLESFVSRETVEACRVPGRHELPRISGAAYFAFADPSGGSSDSFTLAIAHREQERAVLDLVREVKPPFSPESVVNEFCDVLTSYGISEATGDKYAAQFVVELFQKRAVRYRHSERSKSEIYVDALPLMNSGRVELLDNPRMISQLLNLERRTSRGGRDSIDHPPNSHDDLVNAALGAVVLAAGKKVIAFFGILGGPEFFDLNAPLPEGMRQK